METSGPERMNVQLKLQRLELAVEGSGNIHSFAEIQHKPSNTTSLWLTCQSAGVRDKEGIYKTLIEHGWQQLAYE